MRVRLLGPLEVVGEDDRVIALPPSQARLLARLAISANGMVSVDRLIEDLWEGSTPPEADGTLRARVSKLRKALVRREAIVADAGGYRLVLNPGESDVGDFDAALSAARGAAHAGDPAGAAQSFTQALRLWRGPVLAGLSDLSWARAYTARLDEDRAAAAEEMVEVRLAAGQHALVVGDLEGLTQAHPYRERLWAARMLALYRSGRQVDALRVYQQVRSNLRDELGIEPSNELRQLEAAILAHDRNLDYHAAGPDPGVRHKLPVPRSSFVGRGVERDQICDLLFAGQLVTLTGIGGCGKTRLAIEVARHVLEHFPQGVFFVELATLSDPELLGQAVAGALDLQIVDAGVEGLTRYLTERRTLMVLDNCEHLLDACGALVDALLGRCPQLHVLATSREALGVEGERAFRVPSLRIDTEATSLFVERACAARPSLQVDQETHTTIVEICGQLDGIALAIELAAARAAHLSPAEILDRLSDRFRLLTGGRRRVHRQQTLSAALDWSHSLLNTDEQVVLRRLAVFMGSFSLEAAEQICHPEALELLGSLVAKSLVTIEEHEATVRYRLLETVRLYAEDHLVASGEAERLGAVHRDWFLGWIESRPVHELVAHGGGYQLTADAANLAAALEWSRNGDRYDICARIASRMVGFWAGQLRLGEMAMWWQALDAALDHTDPEHRAMALTLSMRHAYFVGDYERLRDSSAEVLRLAPTQVWVAVQAWALQGAYWIWIDAERGNDCFEQGRALARSNGIPVDQALWAFWYGMRIGQARDRNEIDGVLDQWLADHAGSPPTLELVGMLAHFDRIDTALHYAPAVPDRSPARRRAQEFTMALIASAQGDRQAMRSHLVAMAKVVREYAIPESDASCLVGFAKLAIDDSDYERASRILATVRASASMPFRNMMDYVVYRYCVAVLTDILDERTIARCRLEGTAISVREALKAELACPVDTEVPAASDLEQRTAAHTPRPPSTPDCLEPLVSGPADLPDAQQA
jgi:predicted ATPase/DNA-binding SARP family transcriptional activator